MLRVMALASLVALAGCHRQADAPGDSPTGLAVTPGDGRVTVSWDQQPGLTYWIFFQPGGSVAAAAPGVPLIFGARSPHIISGLANGTRFAFVMNATNNDSRGGPSSPVVTAVPRQAGAIWTAGLPLGGNAPQNLNGVAYAVVPNRIVAVGNAGTIFTGDYNYTSTTPPPGVTEWTQATVPTGFAGDLSAVTTSGGQFIALGTDGSILTSTDGNTWALAAPILSSGMNGITVGVSSGVLVYVAVGAAGKIFTSTDLVAWTAVVPPPTGSDLYSVSFLIGGFVATGDGGALLTSPDGRIWTVRDSKTLSALRGAAFGTGSAGPRFVVVGDAGTILTSNDGTDWSLAPLQSAQNLRGIAFGSRFVAVGQGNLVVHSDDAITWVPALSGTADLAAIAFAPAMYVAVGAAGANTVSK